VQPGLAHELAWCSIEPMLNSRRPAEQQRQRAQNWWIVGLGAAAAVAGYILTKLVEWLLNRT
jgi:hypothetical protein